MSPSQLALPSEERRKVEARRPDGPRPVRNVVSNWGTFAFAAVSSFFLTPFIVHRLGQDVYGTWALLGSLVGYLGLLDFGVRGAVMRFIAQAHAKGDHLESGRFASAGMFLFSVSSAVAVAGGVIIALALPHLFSIGPELLGIAQLAVILSAGTIALAFINGVFAGIVTGRQRFDLRNAVELAVEVGRVVAVIVALRAGHGLVALAAIQFACGLARLAGSYVTSRVLYPELRLTRSGWSRLQVSQLLGYSLVTSVMQGANMLVNQINAVIIASFLPIAMVTFYVIGSNLTQYARSITDGISQTMTPRISALQTAGTPAELRRVPLLSGRTGTLVLLPIVITFLLRGETFIGLWMGAEFSELSGKVLWVLSLPMWLMAGRQIMNTSLMGLNRHRVVLPGFAAEAVLTVGLSVLWVRSHGVLGVAWGTAVPAILYSIAFLPFVFGREFQIPVSQIWRDMWIRPSLAMIPFAAGSYVVDRVLGAASLLTFFIQVAATLSLALVGAWFIGFSRAERASFSAHLPRWLQPKPAWNRLSSRHQPLPD